jgi:hypothetical protein
VLGLLAAAAAGWSDLLAGWRNPGAAAKLRLPPEERTDPSSALPEAKSSTPTRRRLHSLCPSASQPTSLAPKKRRREDKKKAQSDIPGAFLGVPPRLPSSSPTKPPSPPSARSGPLPRRLSLPGFSEKSEVTFLSLQGWSRLRAEVPGAPRG